MRDKGQNPIIVGFLIGCMFTGLAILGAMMTDKIVYSLEPKCIKTYQEQMYECFNSCPSTCDATNHSSCIEGEFCRIGCEVPYSLYSECAEYEE